MSAAAARTGGRMEGQCLCGAVRIVVDGAHEATVGACHCGMCRRWSGGAFMCFTAAADAVDVEGPVERFASSGFAERAFCATCGSHLWMRDVDAPGRDYDLLPGIFAEAAAFPLASEIYFDQAPGWLRLAGAHRRRTGAEYEAGRLSVEDGA